MTPFLAKEAYDGSEYYEGMVYNSISTIRWSDYTNRLRAANWYKLFDATDGRNKLTWRDRVGRYHGPVPVLSFNPFAICALSWQ
ncbi:MAG: hypothetical protein MUC65_00945 [Pontiellaceae bacterium]|nr:hypothetical protein [Pontiellaceae bacterium]